MTTINLTGRATHNQVEVVITAPGTILPVNRVWMSLGELCQAAGRNPAWSAVLETARTMRLGV